LLQPRCCSGPCPHPRRPRHETYTTRRKLSLSRQLCNRSKARRPAYASRAVHGTTAAPKPKRHLSTRAVQRVNQPNKVESRSGSGSLIRAGRPRTATLVTSSTLAERATRRHERWRATTPSGRPL
jgi:hypothetical protein